MYEADVDVNVLEVYICLLYMKSHGCLKMREARIGL